MRLRLQTEGPGGREKEIMSMPDVGAETRFPVAYSA